MAMTSESMSTDSLSARSPWSCVQPDTSPGPILPRADLIDISGSSVKGERGGGGRQRHCRPAIRWTSRTVETMKAMRPTGMPRTTNTENITNSIRASSPPTA